WVQNANAEYRVRIPNAASLSWLAMRAEELAEQDCSIARPASLLGDRWTLVILRQSFNGIKRFEDFQETLGISRSLLPEGLTRLVEPGFLRREPYKDSVRTRDRYRLTEMGLDLY